MITHFCVLCLVLFMLVYLTLPMIVIIGVMLNETKTPRPRPKLWGWSRGQGQNHEAEAETKAKSTRPRPHVDISGNTYGKGLVFRGQPCPTPRRRGPSTHQFWGFPSIYAHTLCCTTTKFDVVMHVGNGLYLGVSHASHPKSGVTAFASF